MSATPRTSGFFVAGGTLRPNTPSYIKRPADDELFNLALASEFCYVLTARQMGKSSLMIRTSQRLRDEGVRTVIIDLTEIGAVEVEEWYLGLLSELSRALHLSIDLDRWWQDRRSLGNVQRFTNFLRDVVLTEVENKIVIFIDEIDMTLSLNFSDDFFAAIRAMYNARAKDPRFEHLTFILLGVAAPFDLIKDRARTPFNIGQGIALNDFCQADAAILQTGLETIYPDKGKAIFNRVYHWTSGHPYLTQKLCLAVVESEEEQWSDLQVDQLVNKLFLTDAARKETNLQYVRENVLTSPRLRDLLKVYDQVLEEKTVTEDERSVLQNRLKLFGLVRVCKRKLKPRNKIYRQVFDREWIKVNMPAYWTRRLLFVVSFLLLILIGFGGIFGYNYWQNQQNTQALIAQFRATKDPDIRIMSLANLFDRDAEDQARKLFFEELTPEERPVLFTWADPQTVGPQMVTTVKGLYTQLENTHANNDLLHAMAQPLGEIENDTRASPLAREIEAWLLGREFYDQQEYQQAKDKYSEVINLNDRNPETFFDRGLAYVALNKPASALADFEAVVKLDENQKDRVRRVIVSDPILYNTAFTEEGKKLPAIVALLDTPTPTPTNTPTDTPTATNTPTPTITPTPVPTDTPIPTATPTESTPAEKPSDTPTPAFTNTPLPTPTNTPQPAEVIYVQSNSQTHDLGQVSSTGTLLTDNLHKRAAAPAWSPDGQEVAFYGEQGISELGGVYAQGTGIWILNIKTGTPRLLYQIDHVRNINWSPDGDKLAFEIGAPGIEIHSIVIVDTRDGKEIARYPGEQPAWFSNSAELVIKSCAPECGLWRVGIDGQGGKLLTEHSTDSYPTLSPDNKYLVYSSRFREGDWEIYRLNLEDRTEDPLRLTNRPGTDTTPVFSADGLEIYLRTDAFGDWQISAMAVDGSNERIIRAGIGQSDDWGLARPAVH